MERGWTFSPAAVQLLKAFIEGFPKMFAFISANPKQDKYYESNLFEEKERSEWVGGGGGGGRLVREL